MKTKYFIYLLLITLAFLFTSCVSRKDLYSIAKSLTGSSNGLTIGKISLLNVEATSNTSVRVYFSTDVEQSAAENTNNYSIPGLTITNAVRNSADFSIVDLTTSSQQDINYTLTVKNIIDQDSKVFAGDVAPYIKSVSSFSNSEISVYFSEAMDSVLAQNAGNYSVVGLTVFSATMDAADPSHVILSTGSQAGSTLYTLIIDNVKDLNGNLIASPNKMSFLGTGSIDQTQPRVLEAVLVDSNTLEVRFSEPVEQSSAENPSNYEIKDNLGNPLSVTAVLLQSDTSKVWIDISGLFSQCLYTLTVNTAVHDASGNQLLGPPDNSASFAGNGSIPQTFNDGPVLIDPLNEGSNSFGLLTKYKGRIYIGPANADDAVYRLKPDGSDPQIVTFNFHAGSVYSNSLNPGPDNEDGIDYIAGGIINGVEYLFIGPSKSGGNLGYIYFTTGSGNILEFQPMNISALTGVNTCGVSAMKVFNNNLYLGFPDVGGNRPYLHRISNILENPQPDVDFFNLQSDNMPRIGKNGTPSNTSGIVGIDSFGIYNNQIYLANGGSSAVDQDGGLINSTTALPMPYDTNPGDWADVTPISSIEWYNSPINDRFSTGLSNLNKLIPADKAFPAMVVFNNRLYIIRNTVGSSGGPQLWKYDGFLWSLVADNGSGITDMGNPNNSYITLLVVNGSRLYIGYDNSSDGIQIWRTIGGVTNPVQETDFEPVSLNGLGNPAENQTIYSALSIADGGTDYLWLLCGKSGGSLHVYRNSN